MRKGELKKLSKFLKITGMIAIAIGLMLEFGDLKGWLRNKNRIAVVSWILRSNSGMSLESEAAKEFMKYPPPPSNVNHNELTYLTKQVLHSENGPVLSASINYMKRNHERTAYVTTLEEVKEWAKQTPYPWIGWWITLIGFIELAGNWFIDKKLMAERRHG